MRTISSFKIQVKDYQSIIKAELDIEDGLNVIIGKTNIGKSAILRAIDDAIFNKGNDDLVKTGKRYAGVLIDNGKDKFMWRRDSHGKNEKTLYQINEGNAITKVGRTQLDEICKLFNITDVRLSNNVKEKINFWYQGHPPFLTDKTSGQLFEFLSQSSCDKYIKVVKKMESDIKEQKARISQLNANIDVLKTINNEKMDILDRNKGFNELYKEIVVTNNEVSIFNKIEELIERYNSLTAKIHVRTKTLDIVNSELGKFNFSKIKKLYDSIIKTDNHLTIIDEISKRIEDKSKARNKAKIKKHGYEEDILKSSENLKESSVLISEIEKLDTLVSNISNLISSIKDKKNKKKIVKDSLNILNSQMIKVDLKQSKKDIDAIDILEVQTKDIRDIVSRYDKIKSTLLKKEQELTTLTDICSKTTKEFEDFKSEIGVCPYCENTLIKNN